MFIYVRVGGMRYKVVITPNQSLSQVLSEEGICGNLGAGPYLLKYKNKAVDATLPWRLLGISQGAELEGKRTQAKKDKSLKIAMNFDGKRAVCTVNSSTTLLCLVDQGAKEVGMDSILFQPHQESYLSPHIQFMQKVYSQKEEWMKTLSELGISSGSMLRVTLKPSTLSKEAYREAYGQLEEEKKSEEYWKKQEPALEKWGVETLDEIRHTVIMEEAKKEEPEKKPVASYEGRKAVAYLPGQSPQHGDMKRAAEVDDAFFELSGGELLQLMGSQAKRIAEKEQFITQRLREKPVRPFTRMKFVFGDGTHLEASFKREETLNHVYSFLSQCFVDPKQHFQATVFPPMPKADPNAPLHTLGLVPFGQFRVHTDHPFTLQAGLYATPAPTPTESPKGVPSEGVKEEARGKTAEKPKGKKMPAWFRP